MSNRATLSSHDRVCHHDILPYWLQLTLIFAVISLFVMGRCFASTDKEPAQILYINSYHPGYSWSDDIQKGIIESVGVSDKKIDIYVEYLDSRRFISQSLLDKKTDIFCEKYQNIEFDLLIVSDDTAFNFVVKNRARLFSGIPVVFCGYNNFNRQVLYNLENITGVNEELDVNALIETALCVQNEIKVLAFIISTRDASSKRIAETIEDSIIPAYQDRYEIVILKDASMKQIKENLSHLPDESALFIVGQTSDRGDGRELTPSENGRLISAAGPVPSYTFWKFHVGTGVLGGRILTGYDQGKAAGEMALRILNGESAKNIPVVIESPASYMFDYTVMERFDISMDNLPANSIVINNPFSFYETYKKLVWGTALTLAVLCTFIIILSMNIQRRRRLEKELVLFRNDVEERIKERTLDALIRNERNLNEAQRIAKMGSWKWDVKTDTSVCSDNLFSLFGLEPQTKNLSLETVRDFVHPDDRDIFLKVLTEALTERKPYRSVYRIIKADGTVRVHQAGAEIIPDEAGNPLMLVGTQQDITEQNALEEDLRKRNKELEFYFILQQQLVQMRGVTDSLRVVLPKFIELLEADAGGLFLVPENSRSLDFVGQFGLVPEFAEKFGALISHKNSITKLAVRENRVIVVTSANHPYPEYAHYFEQAGIKTGVSVPISAKGVVLGAITLGLHEEKRLSEHEISILKAGGETVGMCIENIRMYEEIQDFAENLEEIVDQRTQDLLLTQEKLKQSLKEVGSAKSYAEKKAAELEAFSYSVSHDLKAPLRGIEGYSQLLEEEYSDKLDGDGVHFLRSVRQSALQMGCLIDDLLKYSRIDRMEMKTRKVDIPELVETLLNLRRKSPDSSMPEVKLDLQVKEIESEPSGLYHVFGNLIDNAIKFSKDRPESNILIESREKDDEWIFRVVDNGIGFDMQYHDRIFEIFQRLEKSENYHGTGVGLAIAKKIINRLGGRIWAESVPQQGSSFYFVLPKRLHG